MGTIDLVVLTTEVFNYMIINLAKPLAQNCKNAMRTTPSLCGSHTAPLSTTPILSHTSLLFQGKQPNVPIQTDLII